MSDLVNGAEFCFLLQIYLSGNSFFFFLLYSLQLPTNLSIRESGQNLLVNVAGSGGTVMSRTRPELESSIVTL